jgi:hypothetical protein
MWTEMLHSFSGVALRPPARERAILRIGDRHAPCQRRQTVFMFVLIFVLRNFDSFDLFLLADPSCIFLTCLSSTGYQVLCDARGV